MVKTKKKSHVNDIILWIGTFLGIIIITVWFTGFINTYTLQDQNIAFLALNKFSEYYHITCNVDEAKIENVKIIAKDNSTLEIKNNLICIEFPNVMKTCKEVLCEQNLNEKFELNKNNYFTFNKKNGNIEVTNDS